MFVVTTVGSSSAGGGGEERPLWSWDGVPSPLSITMVRMKVRGNRTRKPTAKNIALELGSNAEKLNQFLNIVPFISLLHKN